MYTLTMIRRYKEKVGEKYYYEYLDIKRKRHETNSQYVERIKKKYPRKVFTRKFNSIENIVKYLNSLVYDELTVRYPVSILDLHSTLSSKECKILLNKLSSLSKNYIA